MRNTFEFGKLDNWISGKCLWCVLVVTPHAHARAGGNVIGAGVHIYIYIYI